MLGVSYGSPRGTLAWFEPMTLKMLPGRKAQLGGHFGLGLLERPAISRARKLRGPERGRLGSDSWTRPMRGGDLPLSPTAAAVRALSPGCDREAPCRGEHRYGDLRGRRRESPNSPRAPALRAPRATHSSRTDDRGADLALLELRRVRACTPRSGRFRRNGQAARRRAHPCRDGRGRDEHRVPGADHSAGSGGRSGRQARVRRPRVRPGCRGRSRHARRLVPRARPAVAARSSSGG